MSMDTAGGGGLPNVAAEFPEPRAAVIPRVFERRDWICGSFVSAASFFLYLLTTAPSVTLLDSGEFVLAAQHFGVPHPTGYPLWTLLAWLFSLPPVGNPAWQIALFSGVAGSLAVGLCALLLSSMLRWIFGGLPHWLGALLAIVWSMLFATSESMWSQAVIAEVYTLHALIVGAFLGSLYLWIRNPVRDRWLLWSVFFLALGFTNHHLILVLAPLPLLALLLMRRDLLPDFLAAGMLTAVLWYLLFAMLSGDPANLKTALRFTWLVLAGFAVFCAWRRFRLHWDFVAFLPFVAAAGLLPYAYMPLASSTNPPMNWGYTSTKEGFFFSINRSQYGGSLDDQLLRTVGRAVGTNTLRTKEQEEDGQEQLTSHEIGRMEKVQRWAGFFWYQLWRNFSIVGLLGFFAALSLIRSAELAQRTWLYLIMIGFFLAAFLQPLFDGAEIDRAGWWLQMPYHTYTMLVFVFAAALGSGVLLQWLRNRHSVAGHLLLLLLVLTPFWVGWKNYGVCSQRDRWFGWKFGYEMLRDLPKNAFVFGGTDPGRFIPTYLILGESTTAPHRKIDPEFDRRDLFIVTQNAMTDPFYFKYIRDHYSQERPPVSNSFERWLGRETQYPEAVLDIPGEEEVREAIRSGLAEGKDSTEINSDVARMMWERNKGSYPFFVEESFPMEWSYDYAVPHGLVYQIMPEPVEELPADILEADHAFWKATVQTLLSDPRFANDYDAQRSFSTLRQATANLYLHRKLYKEAESAMREALALCPGNGVSLLLLSRLFWDQGRYEEAIEIWDQAVAYDPNNLRYQYLRSIAHSRPQWEKEITELRKALADEPNDTESRIKLINTLVFIAEEETADEEISAALEQLPDNEEFLRQLLGIELNRGRTASAEKIAEAATRLSPEDPDLLLLLASLALQRGDTNTFYTRARGALEAGGERARETLLRDRSFTEIRNQETFQNLVNPTGQ